MSYIYICAQKVCINTSYIHANVFWGSRIRDLNFIDYPVYSSLAFAESVAKNLPNFQTSQHINGECVHFILIKLWNLISKSQEHAVDTIVNIMQMLMQKNHGQVRPDCRIWRRRL